MAPPSAFDACALIGSARYILTLPTRLPAPPPLCCPLIHALIYQYPPFTICLLPAPLFCAIYFSPVVPI
eukprot:564604-Pleurochrysis_carterae.AAC.2